MRSFGSWGIALSTGALLAGLAAISDTRPALAVGTRTFELDTADRFGGTGSELKGTAITSLGEVAAGWNTARTTLVKGTNVWSALALADGSVLLGVGPEGRVLKIDAAGKESIVAEIPKAAAITALSEGPNGKIYVATLTSGEIYVVDPNAAVGVNPSAQKAPTATSFGKVDAEQIHALVYDKKRNELFAGTGPDGKIFRVDAAGKSQLYYASSDSQVVSLAFAPSGTLYAGTSTKGLLLAITSPTSARVIEDFGGNEVRGIAFRPTAKGATGDSLYCIVNEWASAPEAPKKSSPGTKPPSASSDTIKIQKGRGEVWRIDGLKADGSDGVAERLVEEKGTTLFSLAIDPSATTGNVVYVGTAQDGRVIGVDDVHNTSTVAKAESRLIGGIGISSNGVGKGAWFAAGDAGAFHRVTGIGGPDTSWTSRPLDAGLKASFGKLSWRASGAIELETRSGETSTPDDSWSKWSAPLGAPGKITSPQGRYLQVRARWKTDAKAILRDVTIAFVTENLRAIVTDVGTPAKASMGTGLVGSGNEVPKKDAIAKLTWHVDNPDNDALRYRLSFRKEESNVWRSITKDDEPLSGTEYSWNTEPLSEGWYRVKVEASDEIANPIGKELKHSLESAPFVVDNTPPTIKNLTLAGGRLQGEVEDGLGPIVRLEVEIDGKGPWRPITSKDGILDDAREAIDATLGVTGNHVVAVRAYDEAGNATTKEVEGK